MVVTTKNFTTFSLKEFGGEFHDYEVWMDGTLYITTNAENAAHAKRIAVRVANEGMSIKEAYELEERNKL